MVDRLSLKFACRYGHSHGRVSREAEASVRLVHVEGSSAFDTMRSPSVAMSYERQGPRYLPNYAQNVGWSSFASAITMTTRNAYRSNVCSVARLGEWLERISAFGRGCVKTRTRWSHQDNRPLRRRTSHFLELAKGSETPKKIINDVFTQPRPFPALG